MIDPLAASIYERFGRLDIVVGNAAMLGALSPAAHGDAGLWQRTLEVNLVSNYRLIRACHPLLKLSEAGRAVFVTCGVGRTVTPYWNAFAVSKAGLEMLVRTYAAEVAKTPIRVNLVDTGPVATRLRASAFPGEAADQLPSPRQRNRGLCAAGRGVLHPQWSPGGIRVNGTGDVAGDTVPVRAIPLAIAEFRSYHLLGISSAQISSFAA